MSVELEKNAGKCAKCGGRVCICSFEDKDGKELWTAHCMECDQKIGDGNGLSYHCENAADAAIEWELLNDKQEVENDFREYSSDNKGAMMVAAVIFVIGILFVIGVAFCLMPK